MQPMHVTFYSYKGGVGRSMALANIACLLAQDKQHPQKVLLWDFDLEAPGLHKLFPPKDSVENGFVDLVHQFVSSGELPNPGEFVYRSKVSGVDVLPAGTINDTYCSRLSEIDWPSLFTEDPSDPGPLFGALRDWMTECNYDYVLIDSRTGLNDTAGICTQVLPDLLVMVFRVTDQNVDGLEHLVPTIRSQLAARGKGDIQIMPVASTVIPQSSTHFAERRQHLERVFSKEPLPYIRFDPELIANETLFCRKSVHGRMWPVPSIVDDYTRLCEDIRGNNQLDTKTLAKDSRRFMRNGDFTSAERSVANLVKRRPTFERAWHFLRNLSTRNEKFLKEADAIVDRVLGSTSENVFALQWKASQHVAEASSSNDNELESAADLLRQACEISTNDPWLFRNRADVAAVRGDLAAASEAMIQCHELTPDNSQNAIDLSLLYLRRGRDYFVKSQDILSQKNFSELVPSRILRCYLQHALGESSSQEVVSLKRNSELDWVPDFHYGRLMQAHCVLLTGDPEHAISLADECRTSSEIPPNDREEVNWAEFYLCAEEFARVKEVLEGRAALLNDSRCLLTLSEYLSNESTEDDASKVIDDWNQQSWNFTELILFRERVLKSGRDVYDGRLDIIEQLIRENQLEWLGVRNEDSVFWRRHVGNRRIARVQAQIGAT